MQVYQARSRRGCNMELIAEYEGLDNPNSGAEGKAADSATKAPIPVVFYGQHYDALLDENLKPSIRSEL